MTTSRLGVVVRDRFRAIGGSSSFRNSERRTPGRPNHMGRLEDISEAVQPGTCLLHAAVKKGYRGRDLPEVRASPIGAAVGVLEHLQALPRAL